MKPETVPELLRLAVTSLTLEELREWLLKPSALTARRFLALGGGRRRGRSATERGERTRNAAAQRAVVGQTESGPVHKQL